MRSPFNTHAAIYAGPSSATPFALRGVFPCRLVVEDGIHSQQRDPGQPIIPAYLTIENYRPHGMFTMPHFSVDPGLSDRVAVPATGPINYYVFYTDFIRWKRQRLYYRAYLLDWPPPGELDAGVVLSGVAVVGPDAGGNGGGVACGGTAQPILWALSGGVLLNGVAYVVPGSTFTTLGGVCVNGTAYVVPGTTYIPIGGVVLGGFAQVIPGSPYIPIGGVLLNASAVIAPGSTYYPSGGVVLSGRGSYSPAASGSVVFTEFAIPQVTTSPAHGLTSGDHVIIAGCTFNVSINGTWPVEVLSPTVFEAVGAPPAPFPGHAESGTWTLTF